MTCEGLPSTHFQSMSYFSTMDIVIGRATPGESGALSKIAHEAKASWDYPDAWIERWSDELTIVPAYLEQATVNVARNGELPVGFYALVPLVNQQQDWELDHLWVAPEAMRQGLGKALMAHATQEIRDRGGGALFILSDPNAEAFYQSLGAQTIGRRDASMDGHERWLPEMELTLDRR